MGSIDSPVSFPGMIHNIKKVYPWKAPFALSVFKLHLGFCALGVWGDAEWTGSLLVSLTYVSVIEASYLCVLYN